MEIKKRKKFIVSSYWLKNITAVASQALEGPTVPPYPSPPNTSIIQASAHLPEESPDVHSYESTK